jgi:NADH-quinone oxidoreductase subunit G/[NiFe] hydrogenase diaphorase moiety small subunit/NADP-reducing hydrogenase subunit HndD
VVITGRTVPFENLNITPIRGLESIKEATIKFENCVPEYSFLEGVEAKFAIAHGLTNARVIMDQIVKGESPYLFIEIMACPGGCIGGGGQPIPTNDEIRKKRIKAIYDEDMGKPIRMSHENPEITQIYEEFLKEPLGEKSHHLLHTKYRKRKRY